MNGYLGQSVVSSEYAQQPKAAQGHRGARARARDRIGWAAFSRESPAASQGPGPEASVLGKVKWAKLQAAWLGSGHGKVRTLDRFTWRFLPLTLGEEAMTLCISCGCVCV